jgi:hypothetical protein
MPDGSTPFSEESKPHLPPKNLNHTALPPGARDTLRIDDAGSYRVHRSAPADQQRTRASRKWRGSSISRADSAAHGADQGTDTADRGYTGRGRGGGRLPRGCGEEIGRGRRWRRDRRGRCPVRSGAAPALASALNGRASGWFVYRGGGGGWARRRVVRGPTPIRPSDHAIDGRDGRLLYSETRAAVCEYLTHRYLFLQKFMGGFLGIWDLTFTLKVENYPV